MAYTPEGYDAGPGMIGGITRGALSGAVAGPPGVVVGGVVGLIGQGIGAYINAKRQREAKEDADKKHEEYMDFQREKFEADLAYQQQRLGLDRTSLMAKLKQQEENNENYYNERNYSRANDWYKKTMNQLNQPDMKNKLQNIYAQAA
jgi:phage tail tape-measure protein